MLISRKLLLLLGALCLFGAYPRAGAAEGPPLVIRMALDRDIMEVGDPLWLEIAVTNASSQRFPAPNLHIKGEGLNGFITLGLLRPRVFDSSGRELRFGIYGDRVSWASYPKADELVVWLKPGETVRRVVKVNGLSVFTNRPGDYALAAPLMYDSRGVSQSLKPYTVSNTCFIRVVPKGQLVGAAKNTRSKAQLAVRFQVDGRRAWSRHLPATIKGQTYVPAEVAAKLLRARIENTNGRITLKRDGQTLAFLTREQTVVLPSGKRLKDLGLVMAGKQVMLPQKALEQAFGPMTGLTWGIRSKS